MATKNLCKGFEKVLPYLTSDKKVLQLMLDEPSSERIVTSRVLPYLENIEENKKHIRNCNKCSEAYDNEVDRRIVESGEIISRYDMSKQILDLFD